MARILVEAPDTVAGRDVQRRILDRLSADGHEGDAPGPDVLGALEDADAFVVILDGPDARCMAATAACAVAEKPVLALVGRDTPPPVESPWITWHPGTEVADWLVALPAFYGRVRPFAGRVVRDLVPRLVQEAGHEVRFRAAEPDERPRHLKQKILREARDLVQADRGAEAEEIADLLEALEALIRERGYDRESLKRIKQNKHRQRGGFERVWVVEAGAATQGTPDAGGAPQAGTEARRSRTEHGGSNADGQSGDESARASAQEEAEDPGPRGRFFEV